MSNHQFFVNFSRVFLILSGTEIMLPSDSLDQDCICNQKIFKNTLDLVIFFFIPESVTISKKTVFMFIGFSYFIVLLSSQYSAGMCVQLKGEMYFSYCWKYVEYVYCTNSGKESIGKYVRSSVNYGALPLAASVPQQR